MLIATGLGVGLLPAIPGTWASLAALPCAWGIRGVGGAGTLLGASGIAFAVGCWAAGRAAQDIGHDDPGSIVIDEIAAQWLVLAAAPHDWRWYAAAFLLFRLFDILKPWPIRSVERAFPGGFGIMVDDVLAAIYAGLLLLIGEGIFGVRP
jgi:phosphatidylglycerophosphatase A